MTANSSSMVMPSTDISLLDYTEIDQGLNLWSEILPMIEKQIATLTTVAQEMQECPGNLIKSYIFYLIFFPRSSKIC
jgi:hypothetical protein